MKQPSSRRQKSPKPNWQKPPFPNQKVLWIRKGEAPAVGKVELFDPQLKLYRIAIDTVASGHIRRLEMILPRKDILLSNDDTKSEAKLKEGEQVLANNSIFATVYMSFEDDNVAVFVTGEEQLSKEGFLSPKLYLRSAIARRVSRLGRLSEGALSNNYRIEELYENGIVVVTSRRRLDRGVY